MCGSFKWLNAWWILLLELCDQNSFHIYLPNALGEKYYIIII